MSNFTPNKRPPYSYDFVNLTTSMGQPNVVHSSNTIVFNFYVRYLLQKLISVFKFEGLPEDWPLNYFTYVLFGYGHIAVFNTDRYGVVCNACTLGDRITLYKQPRIAIVTNPVFPREYRLDIGRNCEIIKMQPDYHGGMDIVSTYADLLTMAIESAGINMYNSKMAYVFFAKNKSMAETYKKAYDQVSSGSPMTVVDKSVINEDGSAPWQFFMPEIGRNYITSNLLQDMRTIENQFNTFVGIPNANTQKRERLITSEVEANAVEVQSLATLWLETIRDGLEKVNDMFGTNISVSLRYGNPVNPEKEEDNGNA